MGDMDAIIDGGETILWQGKTAWLPFFAGTILSMLFGVSLLAVAGHFLADQPTEQPTIAGCLFVSPFVLAGLLLAVAYPIWRLFAYRRLSYAITSQRVVSQCGVIEHDVAMIDFDHIVDATVDISLVDIFLSFGQTGSVSLVTIAHTDEENHADRTAIVLSHICHPYDVFRLFHRAEFDVKTDMEYPNRLRPPSNPGYPTTYTPPTRP